MPDDNRRSVTQPLLPGGGATPNTHNPNETDGPLRVRHHAQPQHAKKQQQPPKGRKGKR